MLSGRARKRWAIARGTLRALLGCYLGADPRTLRFAHGAHGKPALIPHDLDSLTRATPSPEGPTRVAFNMTHSGWLALYAFTGVGEVGIDVQVARKPTNRAAIASRAFGTDEARRLAALDQVAGEQEFLQAWVRHEAKLKWLGIGICCPERREGRPLIVQLAVGPSAQAAVAVEPITREIRCWRYRPAQARPDASAL
jgi:4'-phosphopantetheinyl transferase